MSHSWCHALSWLLIDGEWISMTAGHSSSAEEIRKLKQLASITVRRCELELEARGEPA